MKHVGDIKKLNGAELEPVWCITGGSPCQDLSAAGKRAGLAGERSGLFMEQIRIVKEMREHDKADGRTGELVRPRVMVWENCPGAFSSNFRDGFGDFGAVLEKICRVAEPAFSLPRLPEKQKWTKAGVIIGDGWSVAWRTHDAQYWGVPQRRRRISVVADFGGLTAPEILFEREGLPGDFDQSGAAGESSAGAVEDCSGTASYTIKIRSGCDGGGKGVLIQTEKSATLSTLQDQTLIAFTQNQRDEVRNLNDVSGAIAAEPGIKQQTFVAYSIKGSMIGRANKNGPQGDGVNEDVCFTENATDRHAVAYNIGSFESNAWKSKNPNSGVYETEKSKTLDALNYAAPNCNQGGTAVVQCLDMTHANDVIRECGETVPTLQSRMGTGGNQVPLVGTYQDVTGPLMANSHPGSYTGQDAYSDMLIAKSYVKQSVVRRLTPLECERLQGFPDGWVDIGDWTDSKGKLHKDADSPKYKALGNSIALPFWRWMFVRMAKYLPENATLGSLFDGIGGFPLCWERIHGAGTARWASEIEEFPIAVTKLRFPEDE